MLLTETEARKKWCPAARVQKDGTGNRYHFDTDLAFDGPFARCLASDCNLWEWWVGPPTGLPRAVYQETTDETAWRGYCGLKGLRRLTVTTP